MRGPYRADWLNPGVASAVDKEVRGRRAEHALYGSIIVLAIIVAEDSAAITIRVAIGTVLGAALVTSLAHVYADYIGELIRVGRHPSSREWHDDLKNAAFGFSVSILPVGFFFLAALDVMTLDTAFDVAEWVGVGVIGTYSVGANLLAGLPLGRSLLIGFGFTLLGAGLVALKIVL
jgi:multidrug transporter EmrE-like cation transporter